jgi:hypothetical protein
MEVTCHRCGSVFAPDTSAGKCPFCGYNTRTPFAKLRLALISHVAIYKQAPWHILKLMVIGAVSFCVPDMVWHAIRRSQFDWRDVLGLTVVLPVSFFGAYKRLQGRGREETILRWMLLGLWLLGGFLIVLGGFLITVGASFAGAGFDTSSLQILPISLIPGIVYILAAYDGSLMALIIVTAVSLIIWFARLIRHSSKSL